MSSTRLTNLLLAAIAALLALFLLRAGFGFAPAVAAVPANQIAVLYVCTKASDTRCDRAMPARIDEQNRLIVSSGR